MGAFSYIYLLYAAGRGSKMVLNLSCLSYKRLYIPLILAWSKIHGFGGSGILTHRGLECWVFSGLAILTGFSGGGLGADFTIAWGGNVM
jgi:hypothetical protein